MGLDTQQTVGEAAMNDGRTMEEESLKVVAGDSDLIDSNLSAIPVGERGPLIATVVAEHGQKVAHDPECGVVGLAVLCESALMETSDVRRSALQALYVAHPQVASFVARVSLLNPDSDLGLSGCFTST